MAVILCGYYGYQNVGDDQLHACSQSLCRNTITAAGSAPVNGPSFNRWNPISWAYQLWSASALVFGGGSVFQSRSSMASLGYYLGIVLLARLFRCPVLLLCHGWGPFRYAWQEQLTIWVLSQSHVARCWRDESAAHCFKHDPIFCDLALINPLPTPATLNMNHLGVGLDSTIQNKAHLNAWEPVHACYPLRTHPHAYGVCLHRHWTALHDAIGYVITNRYHVAIWATRFGIPWYGVSDDPKLLHLARCTGMPISSCVPKCHPIPTYAHAMEQQTALHAWCHAQMRQKTAIQGWLHEHLTPS